MSEAPLRPAAPADRPLGLCPAAFWIGFFSFREMVRRKRVYSVGLVMLLPVLLPLAWRLLDGGDAIPAALLLANLSGMVYVHFLVALVSLAFGLSAIAEEIDEGTIIYYWTRPLSRVSIYIGRLWAAQTVAATLLVASLAVCFLVIVVGNFGVVNLAFLRMYVGTCVIIVLGAFVYTAVFAAVGTWLRKPMLPAILFAFGWESISGNAPLRLKELTVVFHLRNLIRNPTEGTPSMPNLLAEVQRVLFNEVPPSAWHSLLVLVGVVVVTVAVGCWLLRRKEIFR